MALPCRGPAPPDSFILIISPGGISVSPFSRERLAVSPFRSAEGRVCSVYCAAYRTFGTRQRGGLCFRIAFHSSAAAFCKSDGLGGEISLAAAAALDGVVALLM